MLTPQNHVCMLFLCFEFWAHSMRTLQKMTVSACTRDLDDNNTIPLRQKRHDGSNSFHAICSCTDIKERTKRCGGWLRWVTAGFHLCCRHVCFIQTLLCTLNVIYAFCCEFLGEICVQSFLLLHIFIYLYLYEGVSVHVSFCFCIALSLLCKQI